MNITAIELVKQALKKEITNLKEFNARLERQYPNLLNKNKTKMNEKEFIGCYEDMHDLLNNLSERVDSQHSWNNNNLEFKITIQSYPAKHIKILKIKSYEYEAD